MGSEPVLAAVYLECPARKTIYTNIELSILQKRTSVSRSTRRSELMRSSPVHSTSTMEYQYAVGNRCHSSYNHSHAATNHNPRQQAHRIHIHNCEHSHVLFSVISRPQSSCRPWLFPLRPVPSSDSGTPAQPIKPSSDLVIDMVVTDRSCGVTAFPWPW